MRELSAGNSYIFKVTSSNERGSSSTTCPPVTHEIGNYYNMAIVTVGCGGESHSCMIAIWVQLKCFYIPSDNSDNRAANATHLEL